MFRKLALASLGLGLAVVAASPASVPAANRGALYLSAASRSKLAPNIDAALSYSGARSYIVKFSNPQQGLQEARLAGASVIRSYSRLPQAAVSCDAPTLARLLSSPNVDYVSSDLGVHRSSEFAIPAIRANLVHRAGIFGQGVGIAVIDSGVTLHEDLTRNGNSSSSRVVAGKDFIADNNNFKQNDECGHGTMIAGIAAGNALASTYNDGRRWTTRRFIGTAPEAHVINLRVLDKYGEGKVSNALAALDWCIENKERYNIRVANLSLGHPPQDSYRNDPLGQAVEAAWQSGIIVVCAAGNRGRWDPEDQDGGTRYGTINSPGNHPCVITVGATRDNGTMTTDDDWVASYSSRGPTTFDHIIKPDVVAPGNRITSVRHPGSELERVAGSTNLVPKSYYWKNPNTADKQDYFVMSGTSMAAAFVTGSVALLLQNDPSLSPDTVKARLMVTARKVWRQDGRTPDLFSRGAGLIDVDRALRCPLIAQSPATSPWVQRTAQGAWIHLNAKTGDASLWTDRNLWSDTTLFAASSSDGDDSGSGGSSGSGSSGGSDGSGGSDPTPGEGEPGEQALWADRVISPSDRNGIEPSRALWAATDTWSHSPKNQEPGVRRNRTVPGLQVLWADRLFWFGTPRAQRVQTSVNRPRWSSQSLLRAFESTPPSDPPADPNGSGSGGSGSGGSDPTPGDGEPGEQALWADLFRFCITGDDNR